MLNYNIITIFPKIFDSYFNESIIKRAQNDKLIKINIHNLRDWTSNKHHTVDDTPYGGGAGMLMKIEPLYKSLQDLQNKNSKSENKEKSKIVLLSAKGKTWNQKMAKEYSKLDNVTLICGRYEGVDERILNFVDEEISIGDFILTGGEIAAMTIVDSVSRLIPDVLKNQESIISESHSIPGELEYPQYTKPEIFKADGKEYKVPEILLSGNHKKIKEWKKENSKSLSRTTTH
ncbi:tRNA (guanosine(37)-N1)-methyltransferase TrmD [Candidatus Parcubacteria bacterium]|nr:tRNA (guanosine(37)-N1)-methyltransferase TrmD [Candidatus Parcubacteria bacterium]